MLKTHNRLRILGTHEDVLEIKAFLDSSKKDEKNTLDFKKVLPQFKGEISDVEVGYDVYQFSSTEPVLPVISELSKRFDGVKFALQSIKEERHDTDDMTACDIEKSHHVIEHGEIISEQTSSSRQFESKKSNKPLISTKESAKDKHELVTRESLFDLQDRFFKDVQAFMKDFTESFFKHWF